VLEEKETEGDMMGKRVEDMDEDRPKCKYCRDYATRNYQKVWVEWKVKKDGGYSQRFKYRGMDIEEPVGRDNVHVCEKHAEDWENGNV